MPVVHRDARPDDEGKRAVFEDLREDVGRATEDEPRRRVVKQHMMAEGELGRFTGAARECWFHKHVRSNKRVDRGPKSRHGTPQEVDLRVRKAWHTKMAILRKFSLLEVSRHVGHRAAEEALEFGSTTEIERANRRDDAPVEPLRPDRLDDATHR